MQKTFELVDGHLPILISMPHNGVEIPSDIRHRMSNSALQVQDTDWYLDRLYQFAETMGCSIIKPIYSRYVIDLNRSSDNQNLYPGQNTTELCPTTQFDLSPIYQQGEQPIRSEIDHRIERYWKPYHRTLEKKIQELIKSHSKCLLFEAHSIASQVPRFFEGTLADFNFGSNEGNSCSSNLLNKIKQWSAEPYSKVIDGRFKGGFITRNYGDPMHAVDAIQLELSQATYMDESVLRFNPQKASQVAGYLRQIIMLFKQHLEF